MKNKEYVRCDGFYSFLEFCEWFENNDGYFFSMYPDVYTTGKPDMNFRSLTNGYWKNYYRAIKKKEPKIEKLYECIDNDAVISFYFNDGSYPDFIQKKKRDLTHKEHLTRKTGRVALLDMDIWEIVGFENE